MRFILAFCFATSVGSIGNTLQSKPPSDAAPRREVHIHAPAGTKIGPNDKVVPGTLLKRVNPTYPPLARQTRISGTVRFHVTITTEGNVQDLQVVSGHPLLVQSATDAVLQWKYQPTLLNGQPVEVDTTIDVIFSLDTSGSSAAPSPTPQSAAKIDPNLHADIRHMLDIMHSAEKSAAVGRQMFDSMRPMLQKALPDTPNRDKIIDAYEQKLVKVLETEEYQEGSIAIYAKYFNDQDIQELTKFYETPVGQKFNDNLTAFTADVFKMAQTIAQQKVPGMIEELCKEYPELNGKFPACHAMDGDKKSQLAPPQDELAARNAGR